MEQMRKEYGDSIYDDLRMLCQLRHWQRDEARGKNSIWCMACEAYVRETLTAHMARHLLDELRGDE
jgi:hypothetical protein